MGMEQERDTWLQVRMSNEEKLMLAALAAAYDVTLSQMVRMMIAHFDEKRPTISLRFGPKADAPALEPSAM